VNHLFRRYDFVQKLLELSQLLDESEYDAAFGFQCRPDSEMFFVFLSNDILASRVLSPAEFKRKYTSDAVQTQTWACMIASDESHRSRTFDFHSDEPFMK